MRGAVPITTRSAPNAMAFTTSRASLNPPETASMGASTPSGRLVLATVLTIEAIAPRGSVPTTRECILEDLEIPWTITASAPETTALRRVPRSATGPVFTTTGEPPETDLNTSTELVSEPSPSQASTERTRPPSGPVAVSWSSTTAASLTA